VDKEDFEFLFSVLKLVVKEEQKGVLAHNALLKRMLSHYAAMSVFRSSPELDEWLDDVPNQLRIGTQLAAELGRMAR